MMTGDNRANRYGLRISRPKKNVQNGCTLKRSGVQMHFSSNDHCCDLLYNFPHGNLHMPMVLWHHRWHHSNGLFPSNGPLGPNSPLSRKWTVLLKWSLLCNLPFHQFHWSFASWWLYGDHPQSDLLRGPSHSGPMPIWCLSRHGHFQLFSKRHCFIFYFSKHWTFWKQHAQLATLLPFQQCLTFLHWTVCAWFPVHKTVQDCLTVAQTWQYHDR